MALINADRVFEVTTTTGTSDLALGGALLGYRTFGSVMANGDTCYYVLWAVDSAGLPTGVWECGLGTWVTGGTLQRTTVNASSTGSKLSLAAGTKRVALALTASNVIMPSDLGVGPNQVSVGYLLGSLAYQSEDAANIARLDSPDIRSSGGITLNQASGTGLKVNTTTPAWGWRDLTSDITVRGTGAADPTFALYGATALRAYQFSATVDNEVFMTFHVPHDWVPGTAIYFHAHWSNAAATPNTGTVRWGFEYSFAKGFNQEAFPATATVFAQQASSATRYQHMVTETTAVTIPTMEVDGLILVRAFRDADDAADTCTDAVFLHTVDIHYQSTNMATAQKSPSFYA